MTNVFFFFFIRTNHRGDGALDKAVSMQSLEPSRVTSTLNHKCHKPELCSAYEVIFNSLVRTLLTSHSSGRVSAVAAVQR